MCELGTNLHFEWNFVQNLDSKVEKVHRKTIRKLLEPFIKTLNKSSLGDFMFIATMVHQNFDIIKPETLKASKHMYATLSPLGGKEVVVFSLSKDPDLSGNNSYKKTLQKFKEQLSGVSDTKGYKGSVAFGPFISLLNAFERGVSLNALIREDDYHLISQFWFDFEVTHAEEFENGDAVFTYEPRVTGDYSVLRSLPDAQSTQSLLIQTFFLDTKEVDAISFVKTLDTLCFLERYSKEEPPNLQINQHNFTEKHKTLCTSSKLLFRFKHFFVIIKKTIIFCSAKFKEHKIFFSYNPRDNISKIFQT